MKKFISMVMAAAMVVTMVPATAFAANTADFKVGGAVKVNEGEADDYVTALNANGTKLEVQIIMNDVDGVTTASDSYEITLDFDNIEAVKDFGLDDTWNAWGDAKVVRPNETGTYTVTVGKVEYDGVRIDDTTFELKVTEDADNFKPGDMIIVPLSGNWGLTSDNEGTVGTVTVSGDFGTSEAMPVVSVLAESLDINVKGKNVEIAEELPATMERITIESVVGDFASGDVIKMKLTKGFEITTAAPSVSHNGSGSLTVTKVSKNEIEIDLAGVVGADTLTINKGQIKIEAVTAKAGEIASFTVTCKGYASDSDEAAVVIAEGVVISVDKDEDVPEIYSGTAVGDAGLTSDGDHEALTVTFEETVAGSWDTVDKWNVTLPEGVHVVEVATSVMNNVTFNEEWAEAYVDGDYENFEFGRRAISVVDDEKIMKFDLTLTLVAEPGFEGEVELGLVGDGVGEVASVVIAKFVAPYTVEAVANEMIIDYKETEIPSEIVIKEVEEGLWAEPAVGASQAVFNLFVERMQMEDMDVAVDEDSEMEIDSGYVPGTGAMGFEVETESDEAPAVITISGVKLYMERNIPAGYYDLDLTTTMSENYAAEIVFGADTSYASLVAADQTVEAIYDDAGHTVKEGFINVITAGRDQDDSSFTTQIVVPVGEMYLIAGEETVALDVPAYISAEGYTMMPVRAVATALGINNNSVLWDQATKTVTILYGNRVISMQVGSRVMYVGGTAVPTSAAPEVVDGRTFLPLRDLGTALGVTKFAYDPATKTASMN